MDSLETAKGKVSSTVIDKRVLAAHNKNFSSLYFKKCLCGHFFLYFEMKKELIGSFLCSTFKGAVVHSPK